MGFWNKMFPYSNVHELNLDWLISKMKELSLSVTAIAERLTSGIVRTDEIQHLDDQEKLTARTNIGAAPSTSVRYDATQVLTSEQKTTALENIGAVDKRKILGGFVRYDMAQPMGDEAQRQARANIGATSLDITSLNYVSFVSEQNLSEAQKARARNNIGAGTGGESADGAVRYDEAQNLETEQKYQARQNIDAVSTDYVNDNFVAAYQGQTLTPAFKANARGNIAAVSYEAQTLTSEQQAQARANIGAGTGSGSVEGAVRYDAAQNLTEPQKKQARDNIGAGTGSVEGAVRYDVAQTLDTTEQRMARSNIGAAASADIPANAVSYDAQTGFTNLQREQACENIGAVTYLMDQILNDTEKAQARKNLDIGHLYSSSGTGNIGIGITEVFTPILTLPKGNYIIYGLGNSASLYDMQLFNGDVKITGDPITSFQRNTASAIAICTSKSEIQLKAKIATPSASTDIAYAYLLYALAIS